MIKHFLISALAILSITSTGCAKTESDPFDVDYNDAWMMTDSKTGEALEIVFSPVMIMEMNANKKIDPIIDAVVCDKQFKMCVSYQFKFDDVRLEKVSYNYAYNTLNGK